MKQKEQASPRAKEAALVCRESKTKSNNNKSITNTNTNEEKKVTGPIVSFWRLASLEFFIYIISHLVCLGLVFFAPSDIPISAPGAGLLRQHRGAARGGGGGGGGGRPSPSRTPFSAFETNTNIKAAAAKPSLAHQVSSDVILTLLLVFTSNGYLLALISRVSTIVANNNNNNNNNGKAVEEEKEEKTEKKMEQNGNEKMGRWQVDCAEFIYNAMFFTPAFLCVVVGLFVVAQPPNQVRAFGPSLVLMKFVVGLVVLHASRNVNVLGSFLKGFQAIIIAALVYLVVEANLFSSS